MHVSTCTRPRARVPTCTTHAHACNSDSRTRLSITLYVHCLYCLAVEVDWLYPRKIVFAFYFKDGTMDETHKATRNSRSVRPLDCASCIVQLFSSLSATTPTVLLVLRIIIQRKIRINGYPITGLEWHLGHQELEVPRNSRQSAYEDGKIVSPTHRPPLPPWDIPGTHFC
jgi:hypothetical protein